jgi:hypothetical protein
MDLKDYGPRTIDYGLILVVFGFQAQNLHFVLGVLQVDHASHPHLMVESIPQALMESTR